MSRFWFYVPEEDGKMTVINVVYKGADPTGVLDSRAAFIAARDDSSTAVRYVPAGTYLISNVVTLSTANQIWFFEPGSVLKHVDGGTDSVILEVTGAGVRLAGWCTLDGNRSARPTHYQPALSLAADGVSIDDIRVTNTVGTGISSWYIANFTANRVKIDNCAYFCWDAQHIGNNWIISELVMDQSMWGRTALPSSVIGFKVSNQADIDDAAKGTNIRIGRIEANFPTADFNLGTQVLTPVSSGLFAVEIAGLKDLYIGSFFVRGAEIGASVVGNRGVHIGSTTAREVQSSVFEISSANDYTFGSIHADGGLNCVTGIVMQLTQATAVNRNITIGALTARYCQNGIIGIGTHGLSVGAMSQRNHYQRLGKAINMGASSKWNISNLHFYQELNLDTSRPQTQAILFDNSSYAQFNNVTIENVESQTPNAIEFYTASNPCDHIYINGLQFKNCGDYSHIYFVDATVGTNIRIISIDDQFQKRDYLNARDYYFVERGTGSPEGVVYASKGSQFFRTDGGTSTTFYVKETGTGVTNTGWVAK